MVGLKLSFLSSRTLSRDLWDPRACGWSQEKGGNLWMYFCHEAVSHLSLWGCFLLSFVSGIAWGMILRLLSSVCLEKGDSLLQLSSLYDLVPSYGGRKPSFLQGMEQQSRTMAKRCWLSKFKQNKPWTPQTQDFVT